MYVRVNNKVSLVNNMLVGLESASIDLFVYVVVVIVVVSLGLFSKRVNSLG